MKLGSSRRVLPILLTVCSHFGPACDRAGALTPPLSITCPSDVIAWTCTTNDVRVNYATPRISGGCSANYTNTCTPPSGSFFAVGTRTVICDVTDDCGNRDRCTFTVTVRRDTNAPVIVCPQNVTNWTCGTAAIPVSFPTPVATDDHDTNLTVTCSPPSGSLFTPGAHTVVCNARDDCGNIDRCTFTVTVVRDTNAPIISCPSGIAATAAGTGGKVVRFSVSARDDCDPKVDVVCEPASGSVFPIGVTTVRCRATDDCGNSTSCSFQVRILAAGLAAMPGRAGPVLTWNGCATLLQAYDPAGPWSAASPSSMSITVTVVGATSTYSPPMDSRQRFFRLRVCRDEPEVNLLTSDNLRLRSILRFPQAQMQELSEGGEDWTKIMLPGLAEGSGQPGQPAVPVLRRLIAVPRGADPYIEFARPAPGQQLFVNLHPYQPLQDEISTEIDRYFDEFPPPELFAQQPFVKDPASYGGSNLFPSSVCRLIPLGSARGLEMAMLECACGEYNPATRVLQLYESVDVEVGFKGGTGLFLSDAAMNPFERGPGVYTGAVLNQSAVEQFLDHDVIPRPCAGEELLILTHPTFRPAADALAQWRNDHGIPTSVFNVNDGAGSGPDTKEDIRAFIAQRYNSCVVRPSYVLLFGDHPGIPTWIMHRLLKAPNEMIATDFPYATLTANPEALVFFPDFAVGRIPVNSAAEAQAVVDKITYYEGSPPLFSPAYNRMTIASYFQCCSTNAGKDGVENGRSFILNAEFLRNSLLDLGYDVDRIYDTSTSNHPEYSGDPKPRFFADGTPLPAELAPSSGFAWDGNTEDITNAINTGRSFVFHVDHGAITGWGDPSFRNTHVPGLTNAFWPVVFDFDCSSGNFESTCFAETILKRPGAGAIGVFGWTRMSNTAYYRALMEGTLGALWPESFPAFGDGTPKRRLGDIHNYSRLYMTLAHTGGSSSAPDFTNTINHVRLYHLIGDPTLEAWTANPNQLPTDIVLIPLPDFLEIHYGEEGALISVQQKMADGSVRPIARGMIKNGMARLAYVQSPVAGPLFIAAGRPDAVSMTLPAVQFGGGAP